MPIPYVAELGSVGASLRAALLVLRKWPAVWVLVLLGPFLTFFFSYFLPYFEYLSARSGASSVPADALLSPILPDQLLTNVLGGFALYGSAVAIVLGALVAGGEYGRGTLKTALTQRPTRLETYGGQVLALLGVLAVSVLITLLVGASCSLIFSSVAGEAASWPTIVELALGIGAALLASTAWAAFGVALGILFRGAGLAIGAGLIWITFQGLVETVALQAGGALELVYKALPAANTIAVTGAFSESSSPIADPTIAPWVLLGYAVAFLGLGALLLLRRDVV